MNSDQILDEEIIIEEIEGALKKLNKREKGNICTDCLLYGGELLKVWLKQIFNAITSHEEKSQI